MTAFLFSCNYATCAVPEAYREIFRGSEEVVGSTAGWEPGSLNLAQGFAMKFRTPLVHGDVTRLLIDFENDGDARWSRFSLKLPETTRVKVVDRHERPYRTSLKQRIAEDLRRHDALLHVMIHTDPKTDGLVLLETPVGADLAEKFSNAWRARLAAADVNVRQVKAVPINDLGAALSSGVSADPVCAAEALRIADVFPGRTAMALGDPEKTPVGVTGSGGQRGRGQRPKIPFDWSRLSLRCSLQSMISGCWKTFSRLIHDRIRRSGDFLVSRLAGCVGRVGIGLVSAGNLRRVASLGSGFTLEC